MWYTREIGRFYWMFLRFQSQLYKIYSVLWLKFYCLYVWQYSFDFMPEGTCRCWLISEWIISSNNIDLDALELSWSLKLRTRWCFFPSDYATLTTRLGYHLNTPIRNIWNLLWIGRDINRLSRSVKVKQDINPILR
jgi:hypothetical protein